MGRNERSSEAGGRVAVVYSNEFLRHDPGRGHPERPERLLAITQALREQGIWQQLVVLEPRKAEREEILLVHDHSYLELLRELSGKRIPLDADTPMGEHTYEVALLAAGGSVVGAEAVLGGKNCFCLVRPPGHHAGRSSGAGFCYLNNIAIAVATLRRRGLKRILILDLDAHCGNGTEEIFYRDPSVLYISFHQDPTHFYPGTGFSWQTGEGEGEGYTVNVPLPPGSGDAEYAAAVKEIFEPLCDQFKPELIAVSMGFDAHRDDPLTSLNLSSESFGWLAQSVLDRGRALFVLEGGYDLKGTAEGACNVFRCMLGERFETPAPRSPPVLREVKAQLGRYWKL